jgi:hypothetical protein
VWIPVQLVAGPARLRRRVNAKVVGGVLVHDDFKEACGPPVAEGIHDGFHWDLRAKNDGPAVRYGLFVADL